MDYLAPLGPVYQAGTLSGNPLAMAAGITSLKLLKESTPYDFLDELGKQFSTGVKNIADQYSIPLQVHRLDLCSVYFLAKSRFIISNFLPIPINSSRFFKST